MISWNPKFSPSMLMAVNYEGNQFYTILLNNFYCTQEALVSLVGELFLPNNVLNDVNNTQAQRVKSAFFADDTLIYASRSSTHRKSYTCSKTPWLTNILFQIHTSAEQWEVKEKRTATITSCAVNNISPKAVRNSRSPLQSAPQSRAEQTS